MRFTPTPILGAYLIEPELRADSRGFFARTWCQHEFEQHGLETRLVQCNLSYNEHRGTLRGMHFQKPPHEEAKLVRCTRGRVFDAIVDLREDSESYLRWHGVELSADNRAALYVPTGCAHGYLTLTDGAEVSYQVSEFYQPAAADGVRYDDPAFGIVWPEPVQVVLSRDAEYPLWKVAERSGV